MNGNIDTVTKKEWPEKNAPFKSPWVLGWIAMVVIVLVANITMIVMARKSSTGLVVKDYYEKGKNYDKILEKRARQEALGWKTSIVTPDHIVLNKSAAYQFIATDSGGEPIRADKAQLFAFRPFDSKSDFSVDLKWDGSAGYVGDIAFPLPGNWDIIVSVGHGSDQYDTTKRLFVEGLK